MPAIVTKYLSPTNTRGARIKISADGRKAQILPFDYAAMNGAGVAADDALTYAQKCWPLADFTKITGPHRLDSTSDVWIPV
jgi:hypothetical protein